MVVVFWITVRQKNYIMDEEQRKEEETRIGNEESISAPYGAALHEPVEELAAKRNNRTREKLLST